MTRNPKRREIPNGAKSQTARNPKHREVPNSAKSQTAFNVVWNLAPFGILRRQGFRAVWDFAPFGISSMRHSRNLRVLNQVADLAAPSRLTFRPARPAISVPLSSHSSS